VFKQAKIIFVMLYSYISSPLLLPIVTDFRLAKDKENMCFIKINFQISMFNFFEKKENFILNI